MQKSAADLFIDYIDELSRGRSRLDSMLARLDCDDLLGLASKVLTAVVRAATPPTVPQIGRSLGYPRQTVQRHVDALVERGLVETVDNPDHKTARHLLPTAAGRALYAERNEVSLAWARDFAADFDGAALEKMVATMRAIRHKLEEDSRTGR